ncbi:MAG: hypothetical protein IKZ87_01365 [Actinomycetaceae bacterium]|nr:hypothetical protein [Actinomycetaceae bacterium]
MPKILKKLNRKIKPKRKQTKSPLVSLAGFVLDGGLARWLRRLSGGLHLHLQRAHLFQAQPRCLRDVFECKASHLQHGLHGGKTLLLLALFTKLTARKPTSFRGWEEAPLLSWFRLLNISSILGCILPTSGCIVQFQLSLGEHFYLSRLLRV